MPSNNLNADFAARAIADTKAMEWQASPSATVWRKRLELSGPAEAGRVTSIVRYDPDSAFDAHPHPDGEEILVLDGVFSDQTGVYPAGSFLLNPEGFSHAPFSKPGCILFVKLRQYPGDAHIQVQTAQMDWQAGRVAGVSLKPLYGAEDSGEEIRLVRLDPGARVPHHAHPGGEEIFVLKGTVDDEFGTYRAGAWLRQPPGSTHSPHSEQGCILYVKSGHLKKLV